jgi:hypothetical protein
VNVCATVSGKGAWAPATNEEGASNNGEADGQVMGLKRAVVGAVAALEEMQHCQWRQCTASWSNQAWWLAKVANAAEHTSLSSLPSSPLLMLMQV